MLFSFSVSTLERHAFKLDRDTPGTHAKGFEPDYCEPISPINFFSRLVRLVACSFTLLHVRSTIVYHIDIPLYDEESNRKNQKQ